MRTLSGGSRPRPKGEVTATATCRVASAGRGGSGRITEPRGVVCERGEGGVGGSRRETNTASRPGVRWSGWFVVPQAPSRSRGHLSILCGAWCPGQTVRRARRSSRLPRRPHPGGRRQPPGPLPPFLFYVPVDGDFAFPRPGWTARLVRIAASSSISFRAGGLSSPVSPAPSIAGPRRMICGASGAARDVPRLLWTARRRAGKGRPPGGPSPPGTGSGG
jgi:hypothetical protein